MSCHCGQPSEISCRCCSWKLCNKCVIEDHADSGRFYCYVCYISKQMRYGNESYIVDIYTDRKCCQDDINVQLPYVAKIAHYDALEAERDALKAKLDELEELGTKEQMIDWRCRYEIDKDCDLNGID